VMQRLHPPLPSRLAIRLETARKMNMAVSALILGERGYLCGS
jgi:hypothetical protein